MSTDKQKRMRIFFTGVGGPGTLTATTLLARTALDAGLDVVAGEVHGMAQRGGVVESVLLLGGWRSPRLDLGEADVLLGFEPLETLRGLPYLRAGGAVISSADPLPPLSVSLGGARYPALDDRQKEQAVALLQEIARLAAGRMIELPQCPALRDRIQALETLLGFAEPEEDPYL